MGEPLSLFVTCTTLISTIVKTSNLITSFVRRCRASRHDLDNISRELTSLKSILSLLTDDIATTNDQAIPETLREVIATIITNCARVLKELDKLLQRHNGGVDQAVWWATTGTYDAAKLRSSLDEYGRYLNLALDLLTRHTMGEIRNDAAAIKRATSQILAKIDSLSGSLQAEESRTQSSEDQNDSDSEFSRRPSKSSIPSCHSDSPSLSQETVYDTLSPFPPDIRKGELGNGRTGWKRLNFFANRSSNPYPILLKGHRAWVLAVAFSPDGKLVASASLDKSVRLWDPAIGKCRMTLKGHSDCVRAVAFSPLDGELIASASLDNTVKLWDVATGRRRGTFKGHKDSVQAVAFSPDGKLVASSSNDRTVRLWNPDPGKGQIRSTFVGHNDSIWAVAFSPDGKLVASASLDKSVKLWDPATDQCCRTFEDHSEEVRAVAFSPDGKLVASASQDRTVKLWDSATGRVCRTLMGHKGDVHAVAFSPDGKLVASASLDNNVMLWDVATDRKPGKLVGHKNSVQAVAFSPDGKTVASSSNDRTVRLWDPVMAEM